MATDKNKGDEAGNIAGGGEVGGGTSWLTPSTDFRREPLIPLKKAQGLDTIENPARPPITGKYRLKNFSGRWESLVSSPANARTLDGLKDVQQDLRMPGPGYGDNFKHRRTRSELPGPLQSVGRVQGMLREGHINPLNQQEGDGTDSSGAPVRRNRGTFYFGDIPLPPTHGIYKSGLGWIPENEVSTFHGRHTVSGPPVTGLGRSEESILTGTKGHNRETSRSLQLDGNVNLSSSGQVLAADESKVPSSNGYANDKDMHSKPETGSHLSHPPETPQRSYHPNMSNMHETMLSMPDLTSEQVAFDYMSDFVNSDMSSDGALLTLLCEKVVRETQRSNALSLELEKLKGQLARAMRDSEFSDQAIEELAMELRLMGPRLDLSESQKLVNKDVAATLASGGMPPLDITLDGWTYIRVGQPGYGWKEERAYTPIEPFPPARRSYVSDGQPSPLLPSPPKLPSFAGSSGPPELLQPSPLRLPGAGSRGLSPPAPSSHKRHTWAGNNRSSPVKSSPPNRLSRTGTFTSPTRPTHRHDNASASPGISSRYFNWPSPGKEKKRNN
ncbi:hypothetical protein HOY80DRAFT_1053144 [Tuber brumale]|nr:hypothetical protein HOY80DRAFT_1053144 [Tuber brumale]